MRWCPDSGYFGWNSSDGWPLQNPISRTSRSASGLTDLAVDTREDHHIGECQVRMSWIGCHNRRKSSTDSMACLTIARTVPSGKSPGWRGTVVRALVAGLYQISWLPFAWRSKTNPARLNLRMTSSALWPASLPHQETATGMRTSTPAIVPFPKAGGSGSPCSR